MYGLYFGGIKMNVYTYKLMIKTHNVTGKKYLCITRRDDYISYKGSGLR